jgi:hypothetical protein
LSKFRASTCNSRWSEELGFEGFVPLARKVHKLAKLRFVAKRIEQRISDKVWIGKESVLDSRA